MERKLLFRLFRTWGLSMKILPLSHPMMTMEITRDHGFEIAQTDGKRRKGYPIHAWIFRCTRHGVLDNKRNLTDKERIRKKRGTKKTDCKMALWIKAADLKCPDGDWKVQHYQGLRSHIHNHPPVKKIQLTLFRRHQRRELVEEIKNQKASGIKTQQSLALLQKAHPDLHITLQNLQNERKRLRREAIKHRTPAEACLNLLDELNFYKDFEVGEDNRIQRLYFTDSKSIGLAKSHSDIIMLDCTYQTNKHGLPLLNIIGASSLHKTTQIGLAFLSGEAEYDFDLVMRVLRKLFEEHQIRIPRILRIRQSQPSGFSSLTSLPRSPPSSAA
jgi:MULE transposase domain